MSDSIKQLEELSAEIQSRLASLTYEELDEFMDRRQQIVDSIEAEAIRFPLNAEQKKRIKAVIAQDGNIMVRINFLRNEAANWLQQRNQAKVQRSAYESSYTPDAFLMDSRK